MAVATRQIPRTTSDVCDEALIAQRDALRDALRSLVAHVRRVGGFMSPEDQETLWRAEALLVEGE